MLPILLRSIFVISLKYIFKFIPHFQNLPEIKKDLEEAAINKFTNHPSMKLIANIFNHIKEFFFISLHFLDILQGSTLGPLPVNIYIICDLFCEREGLDIANYTVDSPPIGIIIIF